MDEMKQSMACDEMTFSSAIHGCAQTRDWTAAKRLLNEMRGEGLRPNEGCYYSLVSAASKAGEISFAESLVGSMKNDGLSPDPYLFTVVLAGCARCCDWRTALRILEAMQADGVSPTRDMYKFALGACVQGEAEGASLMLSMMQSQGLERDADICTAAMVAFGKGRRADKAVALMDDMVKQGPRPSGESSG